MPKSKTENTQAVATGHIRIGIGGWTYEPWRGLFYAEKLPQKRELEYASRQMNSIEINGTYYGSQKPETFRKWHDETPDDFVFALKASRFATNRKILADAGPSIERFLKSGIVELRDKLGPINWQFAKTKKFDPADFEAFLTLLPASIEGHALRHAVEVRHVSFRDAKFVELARAYSVAIVVDGDSAFPLIADPTAPFIYARVMGSVETQASGYSKAALDAWAKRIRAWAAGATPSDLPLLAKAPKSEAKARDVFFYVISGYKALNPAAAVALGERVHR